MTMNGAKLTLKTSIPQHADDELNDISRDAIFDGKILFYDEDRVDYNSHKLELTMIDYNLFEEMNQGKWNMGTMIQDGLKDFKNLLSFTKDVSKIDYFGNSIKINLNGQNFNPYILGKLLEKVGYEMEDDALIDYTSGWENDFWIRYNLTNDDESMPTEITICGSLMTFELGLNIGGY